jgi:uncharacterized Zn finger protein
MTAAIIDRPTPVVRLTPCPECSDRRRTLVEAGGSLLGHCLGCGRALAEPLATENVEKLVLLGRRQGGGR